MAAMLVIGVAVGTWMGESGVYSWMTVAADERPRPPAGEARLLMDQSIDQFSRKLQTPERAKSPASQPTRTNAPAPSRAQAESADTP